MTSAAAPCKPGVASDSASTLRRRKEVRASPETLLDAARGHLSASGRSGRSHDGGKRAAHQHSESGVEEEIRELGQDGE